MKEKKNKEDEPPAYPVNIFFFLTNTEITIEKMDPRHIP